MKTIVTRVCLAVFAVLATALPPAIADEVVFRRGNEDDPESLDPARSDTWLALNLHNDLFEGLTTLDSHDQPHPAVAESWKVSPDGLTWTFTLKPGLKWSDGSPLVAQDFVYAIRRVADPAVASTYAFLMFPLQNAHEIVEGKIKDLSKLGVEAPDARTLKFTLVRPVPYFLTLMAHDKFMPVPKAAVEKWGMAWTQPEHIVSNGAFKLQEWTPQSRIVAVRNPNYREAAKVKIDKVIYYPIASPTEELNRFRAGELDLTYEAPQNQLENLRQTMGGELVGEDQYRTVWWGFNMKQAPFKDNPKLRKAMSLVIDRALIRDKVTHTGNPIAYGIVPDVGDPNYVAQKVSWADMPMPERVALAKQLYREAGYGPDKPLTVSVKLVADENMRKMIIAMANMWQTTLGLKVELVPEEFKQLLAERHLKGPDLQLFQDRWIGDYPDATTFLDSYVTGEGENDSGYSNPAYDALITEAEKSTDIKKRAELLQKAEAVALEDNPIIPMYTELHWHLTKAYVKGPHESPCGYFYSKDITIEPHS